MKKFPLIIGLITIVVIVGGVLLFSKNNSPSNSTPPPLPTSYEYFWGEGCPHCVNVEEFIKTWEGRDKVSIDKKEVFNNSANNKLFKQRGAYCNIKQNNMGVPLLFTPEGKCISGDVAIIDFFKSLKY
ncbi:hypothetical protein A2W13_01070 [Candidatus Woesebacteria bacterium RBG_16_36_11]|uniref:Thioredoxin domain-containing protein n=3 Tax=Candidatus Woeseibacteriota TaxID=1752722 RepID=A0A1F7XB31_9BACT|nr:MAG: hypothetical protein A2Z67_03075 [Candidatus Woesebacteria bacterium RBG_13_36_22]OGM12221.1 MAG: hypothetical protein A2W13_01070 [Candidatus Woesebacteria bacterium RBG_16_36_11]OGM16180.1 MAG: hypothetical protein A2V55_01450 [Candidatus Woesebacteria bacterium RBG_19FT_COMBO_37_29]